jgi:hypothetical protein
VANQQFRVDVLAPSAAVDSVADADVLATVFQTSTSARPRSAPTQVTVDLSPWSGQTIRLRLAAANNRGLIRAGADDIRLVPIEP